MNDPGYKALGIIVWRGGRWYLQRRYGRLMMPKRTIAGAALGAAAVGTAVIILRRS